MQVGGWAGGQVGWWRAGGRISSVASSELWRVCMFPVDDNLESHVVFAFLAKDVKLHQSLLVRLKWLPASFHRLRRMA